MSSLSGRIALVTGSSSGMGRAIALELAARGASVLCTDLRKQARPDGFETDADVDTDDLIVSRGGVASFESIDVTKAASVEAAVRVAAERYGRLDIMVNNAGIFAGAGTVVEQTEDEWDVTLAVNSKGVFLGSKYAIAQMMSQEDIPDRPRGRVINTASVGAVSGLHLEPAYCASKGAVLALTKQMAVDFGPQRIGVNAVMPGVIQTAMSRAPLSDDDVVEQLRQSNTYPRFGEALDVARAVAFLASDEAEYINGVGRPVDGGFLAF